MVIALLIDPTDKSVEQVEIEESLDPLYKLIGCELVERVIPIPEAPHLVMYIDEEGRLKSGQKCFFLCGHLIAGKAVIIHEEHQAGKEDPVWHNVELIEAIILADTIIGCPDDYDYSPPPPVIVSWDPTKTN